jgi:probable F420-dependent oxidoreductase
MKLLRDRLKVTVEYPVDATDPQLLLPDGMAMVARRADELGFDAIAFTEHPAPTQQWLESRSGHETLDVTSALAFCAAVTERIRLMTYLLVLPYHNPFMAAKALATVDRLSGGRLTVVAGAGYLPGEFEALGVDLSTRNARFDEGLEVMRGLWSATPFDHEGTHFRGQDIVQRPGPVQDGGIPVLIGGNSPLARRRAARNQGWSPLLVDEQTAAKIRMSSLTLEDLGAAVAEVRAAAKPENRFLVQVQTPHARVLRMGLSVDEHLDHLAQLARAGVDSFVLKLPGSSVASAVEGLEAYSETYLS